MTGDDLRVLFPAYRYAHHSWHSGYDLLATSAPGFRIVAPLLSARRVVGRFHASVVSRLRPMSSYGLLGFQSELAVLPLLLKAPRQIVHIPYGENQYWLTGLVPRLRGHRVVVSFHQPPAILEERSSSKKNLRKIDLVVVVARCQKEFFADTLDSSRVAFVPHGVDVGFFSPGQPQLGRGDRLSCLVVGSWLRDFRTLARSIEIMKTWPQPPRFVLVGAGSNAEQLQLPGGSQILSGIDDDSLRRAYRDADIVLLPLLDATANNALLEAMACGCPIVVTDLPGIRDYVDSSCAVLVPKGDAPAMVSAVRNLAHDCIARRRLGEGARARSLIFDWKAIGSMMSDLYRMVAARR